MFSISFESMGEAEYYGKSISYNSDNKVLNIAAMFNYNKFSSDGEISDILYNKGDTDRNQFIEDGC